MAASTPAPPLRAARIAVFAVFSLNGLASALWFVHIPAVTARTGVSHATLGMLLLLMSGSAIVSMQAAGKLTDRFGSRAVTTAAAALTTVAIIGPAFATDTRTLALALIVYGLGFGALDVAMNAHAVQVESRYGRPIMSAFHALFSGGALAGSLAGAAAQRAGWDIRTTMIVAATAGIGVIALSAPRLLPPETSARPDSTAPADAASATIAQGQRDSGSREPRTAAPQPSSPEYESSTATPQHHSAPCEAEAEAELAFAHAGSRGRPVERRLGRDTRKVLALAAIAFALLMAEGVVGDWSALQMRERVGADAATAALAFGAFSTTMTLGRLVADRVSGRFGPVAVVRWGTLLAAFGFALVVLSPWAPLTLAGWALCGIGLSGGVPQVFTAAGNLGTSSAATDMSRVFGFGYVGLLAGPVIIGWLTELIPLTAAMLVPFAAMLVCAFYAHVVAPTKAPQERAV
ncbi:MFS transporter [Nocardia sp. NPDC050406]|uniref:MFS transporter n=1 Tax=Nocardia sp. NPDC050406 TaxID=3364318 RepID=UPI0037980431